MMLDANARVLTLTDHPEVMAILPNITGLNILELGAGIGWIDIVSDDNLRFTCFYSRFTGDLAARASHVTAVDFIEEYIKKNEVLNGSKYTNIEFRCGDATQIQFTAGQFDMVFSNWLLMYLTDAEVQTLAANMLR